MEAELSWATTQIEKEAVYRLRYQINVESQGYFRNDADHARRQLEDALDGCSRIAVAKVDGQVVGTVRLLWGGEARIPESLRREYDLERFEGVIAESKVLISTRLVVAPEYRGRGLAFDLLRTVFEFAASQNVELILGRCEVHLLHYYRKYGFRAFGDLYQHPTNGFRSRIAIVTTDFDYLERIDSPMLEVFQQREGDVRDPDAVRACLQEGRLGSQTVADLGLIESWRKGIDLKHSPTIPERISQNASFVRGL